MLHAVGLSPDRLQVFGTTITWAGLAAAAATLVVAGVVALVLRVAIMRSSERFGGARRATFYTVSRITTYTVLVVGFLVAVGALGLPVSRLAVLAGGLGVGLGFGLQTVFSNFVSGLILLFDRSLKIGDFVELQSGVTGEVRDIKIRSTRITTNDNIDILVPNAEFVSGQVVNWTHREVSRRLRIPFGVAYGTDKEVVKAAALEAAAEVPFTLALEGPRRPQVWLVGFGDSALDFELVVWLNAEATKKPAAVQAAYNWALHTALQTHAIEIPFPQRDITVRSLFGLADEDARRALRLAEVTPHQPGPGGRPRVAPSANDAVDDVAGEAAELPGQDEDLADDSGR